MSKPRPFEVAWSADAVGALLDVVRAYPWPPAPAATNGWSFGCDEAWLRSFCAYWCEVYDWRSAVAELNRFPQFTAVVDEVELHFVHLRGEGVAARPLLLAHGWPGSHYEFWQLAEQLAFPSRFGGAPAKAFDVVIPSLPGFGFSSKPAAPIGPRFAARLFNKLMTQTLGYSSYFAQGGDWGAVLCAWLGLDHAPHLRGVHLNMLGVAPPVDLDDPVEADWLRRYRRATERFGAYNRLQRTRPQSLAWLAGGNPVGQAAWIAERFHDWADLSRQGFETVFPPDRLLTNVMIYVMTGSFTTGAWFYRGFSEEGGGRLAAGERCRVPTAFAVFPHDAVCPPPPRSLVARGYNLVRWTQMPRGGHFAAMEAPELLVRDLQAWAVAASEP